MNINPRVLKYIRTNKSKRFTIENKVGNKLFQELNEDNSFNSVNGYYSLTKDTYPALNPKSFGEKAISEWTFRQNPLENNPNLSAKRWRGISWSPELKLFAAVAYDGTSLNLTNKIMTSPDGINWTARQSQNLIYSDTAWSSKLGLFVAIASTNSRTMTISQDGITWTPIVNALPSGSSWFQIIWSSELEIFVAISFSGTQRVAYWNGDMSNTTWTGVTLPSSIPLQTWVGITWSPELSLFVVIGNTTNGSNQVMISSDVINWSSYPSATITRWEGITWSSKLGIFCAVGENAVMTSSDGIKWTLQTPASNLYWRKVEWSPELNLFVATSNNNIGVIGKQVMTSSDGINWISRITPLQSNGTAQLWEALCWSPELCIFVAVAGNSQTQEVGNRVMTSSLLGRPPTSYNVFDSSFNNIDSSGNFSLKAKNLYSDENTLINVSDTLTVFGNVGINTTQPSCSLDISRNDAILLPRGSSTQRPINPQGGTIRYNTDFDSIEWYNGNTLSWNSLTGVIATGGIITEITQNDINYRVHTFTTVGTSQFQVLSGGEVEYLVIAGGGGAQGGTSGGGGAGGYRCSVPGESSGGGASAESPLNIPSGIYNIIVGAGGSGGSGPANDLTEGTNGGDSVFYTITSIGGGRGGGYISNGTIAISPGIGGSGGGGQNYQAPVTNGANGTVGQGFKGGDPASQTAIGGQNNHPAGGGGGAGGAGTQAGSNIGQGDGGIGVQSNIDGVLTYRGGGGGGGAVGRNNQGGLGGGGQGANDTENGSNGVSNTGGGGGGGWRYIQGYGGGGGSGIVIIRYRI